MTHDKLVNGISQTIENYIDDPSFAPAVGVYKALLAVVELHKPKSFEYFEGDVCETCSWDLDYYTPYPCPTIQAIEGVLV